MGFVSNLKWSIVILFSMGGLSFSRIEASDKCGPHLARGVTEWNNSSIFSALEIDGVRFAAIEQAIAEAAKVGFSNPAFLNVQNTQTNVYDRRDFRYHSFAAAIVRDLIKEGWGAGDAFTKSSGIWISGDAFSLLEVQGVRYSALMRALDACYTAGYVHCEILSIDTLKLNLFNRSNSKFETEMQAVVRGLRAPHELNGALNKSP